jgi:L,D-transpeptidase ErfK/SrfK
MRLGLPGYLIHGTNRPSGVGMRVTHGCIRMFPEDIDYLFGRVDLHTAVRIVNEPVKFGWNGDELVIEVHRTLEVSPPPGEIIESLDGELVTVDDSGAEAPESVAAVADEIEAVPPVRDAMTTLTAQFVLATNERPAELDWDVAEKLLQRADGIPTVAGRRIKDAATSAASE